MSRPGKCFFHLGIVLLLTGTNLVQSADTVSFKRDIRPLLSDNCFACHGPDANHRQADLRLDTREGAALAIKPNHPDQSPLYERLISKDDELRMPPPKSHKSLTDAQIELLRKWIEQGAKWEDHWSFTPLLKPEVPTVTNATSPIRNPIDAFVQYELSKHGWHSAPEADKRTLIRRVTLDLTGLPPTPDEVRQFLDDSSDTAYNAVVQRLLKSPAFGQRMAWDWLDAARYADSNGYQGDNERTMWPWRDWVVQAFNDNLSFDQFTVWQLAGDMLPNATLEQKLATGFCRNHMINGEGGRIAEENRVDYVMDMTETMGTVWLGLTLNCCRCHDHKFDLVTQREYYQLFAFFNQTPVEGGGGNPQTPPVISVPDTEQQQQLDQVDREIASLKKDARSRAEQLTSAQVQWERSKLDQLSKEQWTVARIESATADHQKLTVQSNQSVLASGTSPAKDNYQVRIAAGPGRWAALRLDVLPYDSQPKKGLSRAASGNFVLTNFAVKIVTKNNDTRSVKIRSAKATFEQSNHTVASAFDGNPKSGWAVWEGKIVDRPHAAVFYFDAPIELTADDRLDIELKHESDNREHVIGRFRLALSSEPSALLDEFDPSLRLALEKPKQERSAEEKSLIESEYFQSDEQYRTLDRRQNELQEKRKALLGKVPKVMVMEQRDKHRDTMMLDRGLYNQPRDRVESDVPASLPSLATDKPKDRLALAKWLVSDHQPLTARVIVNRTWQQFFGIGLSKTVEDLGSQGEIPRYLDLLDWLAAEYRDSGWDTKRLVEMIVTSHTYRQSSRLSDSVISKEDPDNRWLARGARFRMPSWMLRDQALAASGLINHAIGGPSVNGYQPEGIWEEATFGKKKYVPDTGDALYRRSLYIFWRRIVGPTMFFDNAARQVCTVKSVRTNTPLHALYMLNDVTFVEAARALAALVLQSPADCDADRINEVFQRLLARDARDDERSILLSGLESSRLSFGQSPELAKQFLTAGQYKSPDSLDVVELASWSALCLAVMNLDETVTKE